MRMSDRQEQAKSLLLFEYFSVSMSLQAYLQQSIQSLYDVVTMMIKYIINE